MVKGTLRSAAGLAGLMVAGTLGLGAQTVSAVPKLDVSRFTGTWYEVARLPDKLEKRCAGDVFSLIALGDKANQFQVVISCTLKKGYTDTRTAVAKTDKSDDGKLKLSFLWPFSTKYWVLALGPEYDWSLIGSPNHKELWVLSRSKAMSPQQLADIEARAGSEGFATAKLVMTPQTAR